MSHLWDALCRGYDTLRFTDATGGDEPFRDLVLARIIEPTSKLDSLRVLDEVGIDTVVLPHARASSAGLRGTVVAAAARRGVRGSMPRWDRPPSVLYDVTTLYFETDAGDGFREPGFSKERRLDPQITIGLLTDSRPGSR